MSRRGLATLAFALTTAVGAGASAQAPTPAERSRLRIEASGGFDTPLGLAGLAGVFRATPWLSAGGGLGVMQQEGSLPLRAALFTRANVLHLGRFTLGPVVSLSFGDRARAETYQRPRYATDDLRWTWSNALRLDAGLGAETRFDSGVTARLELGVGYVVGSPTCTYASHDDSGSMFVLFRGECDAPQIPSYYHFGREPGRVTPYVGLALGFEPRPLTVGTTSSAAPPEPPAPPVPPPEAVFEDPRAGSAWAAPTALLQPKHTVTATLLLASSSPLLAVTAGLLERLELTAVGGLLSTDGPNDHAWMAWLKAKLAGRGIAHLSLLAGGAGVESRGGNDLSPWARFGGAGPVGSLCFDVACRSLFSLSVVVGVAAIKDQNSYRSRKNIGALFSSSLVVSLWRHLKLVAEGHVVSGDVPPLWAVALRVPFRHFAVDAGVALGVPVGSVSARF